VNSISAAHALLHGWAGRYLLLEEWACDVAATYLTLRLASMFHAGHKMIFDLVG
jgi:hypothetical protein